MLPRPTIATLLILLVAAFFLPAGARPAAAQGGPASRLITFESGSDSSEIGADIPGIRFAGATSGAWRYGDARTGNYNAPYPQDCPAFGGPCAYAVSGNLFAWVDGGEGLARIEFAAGAASFFVAGFSTADPLTVEAYDAAGALLASAAVAPNLRTGRLDEVRLEAQGIAAVQILGPAGRWLMDDLRTDAPAGGPGPDQPIAPQPQRHPAALSVVQRTAPEVAIAPGATLSLTIVATNRGRGAALGATIGVALDPLRAQVLDASFSDKEAWVSRLSGDALEIQTGPMSGDEVVTATLRILVRQGAPSGGSLVGERLSVSWRDRLSGGAGSSNALALPVGGLTPPAVAPLEAGAADGGPRFSGAIFAPGEPVAFWYDTPDGRSLALGEARADSAGRASITLATAGLPPGSYALVAHGLWSDLTARAPFAVP